HAGAVCVATQLFYGVSDVPSNKRCCDEMTSRPGQLHASPRQLHRPTDRAYDFASIVALHSAQCVECWRGCRGAAQSPGEPVTMNAPVVRLTSLAHGGGCGCKLAPAMLQELLANQPAAAPFHHLLVGVETGDDAAVWKIDESTCVVATTDFFMPVVDDPFDFGRIAATNAISDIYAMGGKPIMALAILGMPLNKISVDDVRKIIA